MENSNGLTSMTWMIEKIFTDNQHTHFFTMRVILIHGFNANPTMNFHPWLAGALRDKGFEVCVPELPLSHTMPVTNAESVET